MEDLDLVRKVEDLDLVFAGPATRDYSKAREGVQ